MADIKKANSKKLTLQMADVKMARKALRSHLFERPV
jgi:hypothetical protein